MNSSQLAEGGVPGESMLIGPPAALAIESLPKLLCRAAAGSAGIRHLNADSSIQVQSYAELLHEATLLLHQLQSAGLRPQDPVILHFSQSHSFLTAFWACALGGFVPVPIAVAPDYSTDSSKTALLRHAIQMLDNPTLLIETQLQPAVQAYCQQAGLTVQVMGRSPLAPLNKGGTEPPAKPLTGQPTEPLAAANSEPLKVPLAKGDLGGSAEFHQAAPDDLALLIFTSGSTGSPKGVMLTGRSLITVADGMARVNRLTPDSISLNWMPLEHVASLVMFHLTQVYVGCNQIQVDNALVLQQPLRWLDWVNQYRVTHTWAPNFAYGLVVEQAAAVHERNWDLSCLRWMGNGAEAVVGKTTRQFLELLASKGLGQVVCPGYGMSETGSGIVHSHDFGRFDADLETAFVEVGQPIPGVAIRIVDAANQLVPPGTVGRLQVTGQTMMQGYYRRPDLDAEVFTADGWFDTGDLGLIQAGSLTITGRQKEMIILNGVNYYSPEIEAAVEALPGVVTSFTAACAVQHQGSERLAIFFASSDASTAVHPDLIKAIRRQVVQQIGITPHYVIPVEPTKIPKTNLGKIQRSQLVQRFAAGEFQSKLAQVEAIMTQAATQHLPQSQREQQIAEIWREVLRLKAVGVQDNFFELGGNSLLLMQVLQRLQQLAPSVSAVALFQYPTIAALAQYLNQSQTASVKPVSIKQRQQVREDRVRNISENADVAVIGMACRFPGANSIQQFWQNLRDGVESITFFDDAELLASGIDPALIKHPHYVKASPILDYDIAAFDADFFGYSPKEASLLDPQQRLLLECAWECLEDAGYNPMEYAGDIGLYAGASANTYLLNHVYPNRHQLDENDSLNVVTLSSLGGFQLTVANDKDYLTTRISYKLNLTGPSVNVQTACSTSLVAVHMARQSLLNGECDLVLAGGVSVHTPQQVGHLHQDGMILTPDGHCRAFDAAAGGTIFGSGAGLVLLKRLDQAIAAGDRVYAVIKGSAIGNDGGEKVGYLAPKAAGQAAVTAEALAVAGVQPEQIGYVEAHGTGTALGDPIEIAGLTQAFEAFEFNTAQRQFCPIGSVKTNLGHLNIASGIAGFIKTALCLYHKQLPPSLHFEQPNPQIDFLNSPFYVNTRLTEWQSKRTRYASVNSLGIGGTNVHVVLGEAAYPEQVQPERQVHVLTLSAKTEAALQNLTQQYLTFLPNCSDSLADICFTTNVGRVHFEHRFAAVVSSVDDLQQQLQEYQSARISSKTNSNITNSNIAFLFTGQGSQYASMGRELYETCVLFRETLDYCDLILQSELSESILAVIWTGEALDQTICTQPALFCIEYALAVLWMNWGVMPTTVMGHSLGEYVAACVAGVFSLEDALRLVAARARLMQKLPPGMMAAVMTDQAHVQAIINSLSSADASIANQVSVAALNSPQNTVISGTVEAVQQMIAVLSIAGISARSLKVSHAFHSVLMEPIVAEFRQIAERVDYVLPQIEIIANLTGKPAAQEIATADYWCQQLRQPVRFADGAALLQASCPIWIECGSKPILTGMISETMISEASITMLSSLSPNQSDWQSLLTSLGQLYRAGVAINWAAVHQSQSGPQPRRISLPTYPFQRQRYWLERVASPVRAVIHPLLQQQIRSPLKELLFQSELSIHAPAFLADHKIGEQVIFPAAAFAEMALAAGHAVLKTATLAVEQLQIEQPLVLTDAITTVQLVLQPDSGLFQIYSLDDLENWQTHASGTLRAIAASSHALDLAALRETLVSDSVAEHYAQCQSQGLNYGPDFQAVQQLWRGHGEALGQINLPDSSYYLHPICLDAAFQVIAAALPASLRSVSYLPVHLEKLHLYQSNQHQSGHRISELWSHVTLRSATPEQITANIQLLDQSGTLIAEVKQLTLKQLTLKQKPVAWQNWLYQIDWRLQAPSPQPSSQSALSVLSESGSWIILADSQGIAERLATQLEAVDQTCQLVYPGEFYAEQDGIFYINPAEPAEFEQLLIQLGQRSRIQGVLHFWSLAKPGEASGNTAWDINLDAAWDTIWHTVRRSCETGLYLIQALTNVVLPHLPRCWFITCGTQAAGGRSLIQPAQASLWGMGQVVLLEHPELSLVRIDLDPLQLEPDQLDAAADLLFAELHESEPQVAFANGQRYVARLAPVQLAPVQLAPVQLAPVQFAKPAVGQRLEIVQRGSLEDLGWQTVSRRPPAATEVEIQIAAAGLNFRDVLNALDLYPGEAGPLGLEAAGIVVAVGTAVPHLRIGDPVIAIAAGSLGQFVTVDAQLVALKPDTLSMAEAATLPTAFLTAYYALSKLGQLQAGERVLIHAAAGGVGQAAVQIAQQIGAEIFATAAPAKWNFLRAQGIQHIWSSRQLDFAEAIQAAGGVDLVLNSLSGEFIAQSLAVLRPGGRLIEIGKLGVWSAAAVAAVRPDVAYAQIDLVQITEQQPQQIQAMLAQLLPQFGSDQLQPLPLTPFPAAEAIEAFRQMQQAKQIGKIVLEMPLLADSSQPESIERSIKGGLAAGQIRPDASYLITGGLGALGLVLGRWLVEQGATRLILVGRSLSCDAAAAVEALRARANIEIVQADIAELAAVEALFAAHSVQGIFHLAGTLADSTLQNLTWTQFEPVLRAKVGGAWNLHQISQMTQNQPLDCFVLFSSAASLLGSAGQANYAAANAFLDALAQYRQSQGLSALSINWGAWSQLGMAAAMQTEPGMAMIEPEQGLKILSYLLQQPQSQVGVLPIDWAKWQCPDSKFFADFTQPDFSQPDFSQPQPSQLEFSPDLSQPLLQQLQTASNARLLLSNHLSQQISKVLGLNSLDSQQGFSELGLDSLTAVELRNLLQKQLDHRLSSTLLFDHPTLAALTEHLLQVLGLEQTTLSARPDAPPVPIEPIQQLSEAEAEALLLQELEQLGG